MKSTLKKYHVKSAFLNVLMCFKLILTLLASNCSGERSNHSATLKVLKMLSTHNGSITSVKHNNLLCLTDVFDPL